MVMDVSHVKSPVFLIHQKAMPILHSILIISLSPSLAQKKTSRKALVNLSPGTKVKA